MSVINTGNNTIAHTIDVESNPEGVAVSANGTVYVANNASNTVSVISGTTVVQNVKVGTNPEGVAISPTGPEAGDVYVTNNSSGTVSVINPATNAVVGNPVTVGSDPQGVAVNPAGTDVYVANYQSGGVSVISTSTDTVVKTITVPSYGVAVAPDGTPYAGVVYVTSNGGSLVGTVSVIEPWGNTLRTPKPNS